MLSSAAVLPVAVVVASLLAYTLGSLTVLIMCVLCKRQCQTVHMLRKCNTSIPEASTTILHKEINLNKEQIKLKENVAYGQFT